MEEMTGKPFQDILKEDLIDALHLTRSSYNPPKDKYGIIPDGAASFWNLNLGDETP